ncbi:MAG: hypothetical protein MZV64_15070 [Ignavibacteriales bacterium]|nr:hypothetical protein [Ignavibacteriales bacterium]
MTIGISPFVCQTSNIFSNFYNLYIGILWQKIAIVMVKQVPDTANISGQVYEEEDGTVNRAKLHRNF